MTTLRRLCLLTAPMLLLILSTAVAFVAPDGAAAAGPMTYFVDCSLGSDGNSGHTSVQPWQTLAGASRASLLPGDTLLLRRGCVFRDQRLDIDESGTAASAIRVSAYGTGSRPVIRTATTSAIRVRGAHVVVEQLRLEGLPERTLACGQGLGKAVGVDLFPGSHDVTVRNNLITGFYAGLRIARGATHHLVERNLFFGNDLVDDFHLDTTLDVGAWGILIVGDDNVVRDNAFRKNSAQCRNGTERLQSNSVEIFEGQRNLIIGNRSRDDRVFSELGSSSTRISSDNVFAYNEVISSIPDSRFIVTRGRLDARWGPVMRTAVVHNSVYYSGTGSGTISCGLGCAPDIMDAENNVFWADGKAIFGDGRFTERGNLFWARDGDPFIQIPGGKSTTSIVANPRFATVPTNQLRPGDTSPAIDAGVDLTPALRALVGTRDIRGTAVPQQAARDMGCYEALRRTA